MAKLKAPLFSLGASGQLGKALVFFGWKGLDVVREYVVPANPRTTAQTTQRGYLTAAVTAIHTAQSRATHKLVEVDVFAYALWASVVQAATTWFNQACRQWIDQLAATPAKTGNLFTDGSSTPGANTLAVSCWAYVNTDTAGNFHYGTSRTALILTQAATVAAAQRSATLAGLTTGTKYFWQYRPTTPASQVGVRSGIYYGVAA